MKSKQPPDTEKNAWDHYPLGIANTNHSEADLSKLAWLASKNVNMTNDGEGVQRKKCASAVLKPSCKEVDSHAEI